MKRILWMRCFAGGIDCFLLCDAKAIGAEISTRKRPEAGRAAVSPAAEGQSASGEIAAESAGGRRRIGRNESFGGPLRRTLRPNKKIGVSQLVELLHKLRNTLREGG